MRRATVLAVAAIAVAVCTAPGRASAPSPIVFAADRAPTVTGEIYRLDPNGHRIDLSRSPYEDTNPAVSPDGKTVAFLSDRGRTYRVYEVGIDGHGLRTVTSALPGLATGGAIIAWQPQGDLLTVETTPVESPEGHVWLVPPHGKPIAVSRYDFGQWSPDGRILLVWAGDTIRAVTPSGQSLWTAAADQPVGAWSQHGLLAVPVYHGAKVYDESGRLLSSFSFPDSNATFSWSPDGQRLAVLWYRKKYELDVRTPAGKLLLEKAVPGGDMAWAGNSIVVFGYAVCPTCKTQGVDIRTGKASPASSRWLDPLSVDRKLAIVTPTHSQGFSLGVGAPGGGSVKTYEHIGGCYGDGDWMPAAASLQFAGRSRSIVYVNWNDCDPPFANLYSVASAGGAVHRLTNVQAQETQPALSPNGTQIAYVWAAANGLSCKGCSDGIRVVNADGTHARTLTDPEDCTFDDSPTWSPNGSTILYSEDACDASGELYTISAAGGTPHDLGIAGSDPAWGPARIAYVGTKGLMTANPDGTDRVHVTKHGRLPAWSSDGRLAYVYGTTIFVGANRVKLPFAQVTSLAWSPDGSRFVLTAQKRGNASADLYSIETDGRDLVRLTQNYGVYSGPGKG